jgi:hypothetical protein
MDRFALTAGLKIFLPDAIKEATTNSRSHSGWLGKLAAGREPYVYSQLSVRGFVESSQDFASRVGMWHILNIWVGRDAVYRGSENGDDYGSDNSVRAFGEAIQYLTTVKNEQTRAGMEFEGISRQFSLDYTLVFSRRHSNSAEAIKMDILGIPTELMGARGESPSEHLDRVNRLIDDESAVKDLNEQIADDFSKYLRFVSDTANSTFHASNSTTELSVDVGRLVL